MKKIGGSCFRTEGKPRLEELSDKFHSSKSSAESKSVTESSGFDSKARIMVSWSGRKRTSSILILLTTVGKRVNNLAKEQWFDCTIRRSIVEKPINFPPSPFRNFQFLTTSTAGGVKRKLHIIHRETSLQRPFPMKRDRGMNAKSVETNVGWIAFNDNTSLLFQFLSSSSVSFREERNTAERNLIEENKSGSRAQNSFCPRFLPASPESNPPRDYYFRVNNLSTKSETRLLTTFTLSKPNFLENVAAVSLPPTNSTQGANHHLCYHLLQICKPVQAKIYHGSLISFVSNETLLLFIQTHRNRSIELLNNCSSQKSAIL